MLKKSRIYAEAMGISPVGANVVAGLALGGSYYDHKTHFSNNPQGNLKKQG